MRHEERALVREVVVQFGDDLHRRVGLAGPGWADNDCQPWTQARSNGLHLHGREPDQVSPGRRAADGRPVRTGCIFRPLTTTTTGGGVVTTTVAGGVAILLLF